MNKYEFIISAKDRTTQAFSTINKGLGGLSAKAGVASVAVAGVSAAFAALVTTSSRNAKELSSMSQKAGMTAEEFQAMSFAFDQFNISQEKFADISKDVQDKLGDFIATGGGEFADFFENVAPKVGLTVDSLRDLAGPDVLIAVKKAMDDANISAKEQVFYMESIANDATLLLPALENNGDAIKRYADEFRGLNAAMSQSELDTMKQVATDFSRVEAAISGVTNHIALEFAPYIRAAADLIVEATKESEGFTDEIKEGFEVAEDVIIKTAFALGTVIELMGDAYDGYRSMPVWMQEIGLAGAFIGGKKGLAVIAAAGKSVDGAKTTAEWFSAFMDGNIGFTEWLTANNEEAREALDGMQKGVADVGEEITNLPEISFGGEGGENDWLARFKKKVGEYKKERESLSEDGSSKSKTNGRDVDEDIEKAERFLSIVDLLKEINGETIVVNTELSGLDTNSDFLPKDLNLNLPVSGRFDFDESFKSSAEDFWADINENGFSDLKPTIDLTEASAANQALIDSTVSTYQAIHEEKLRYAGMDREIEEERYNRQIEQMERELELLETKGLLTQEIRDQFNTAETEAYEVHVERLNEIDAARDQKMAEGYQALLSVMGSYYDGMEGKQAAYARAAIQLGSVMLDKEKRESIASIWSNTYETAMKAYNAMADIPGVGPFLGAAAAGTVIAAGAAYTAQVSGLASFDGGGYTGDGPRSGGLDRKGGYLAMLHPQEYVFDLTKNQPIQSPRKSASPQQSSSPNYNVQMGDTIIYGGLGEGAQQYLDMRDKRQIRQLKRIMEKPI